MLTIGRNTYSRFPYWPPPSPLWIFRQIYQKSLETRKILKLPLEMIYGVFNNRLCTVSFFYFRNKILQCPTDLSIRTLLSYLFWQLYLPTNSKYIFFLKQIRSVIYPNISTNSKYYFTFTKILNKSNETNLTVGMPSIYYMVLRTIQRGLSWDLKKCNI